LLGQSRADECKELLDKASKGEIEAIVTHFSIHAIEAVVNDSGLILNLLRNLENSLGLYLYGTSVDDEMAAAVLMTDVQRDFDDSLQYYVAKKLGAKSVVSFDTHFGGLDIPRTVPKDVIGGGSVS